MASVGVSPSASRRFCAKSISSTVLDTTMPTMKITPNSDCTLMAVPVMIQHDDDADQADRHRRQNDQRRHVGLEQCRHQEIDQQRRQDQSNPQVWKVSCMREYSPVSSSLLPSNGFLVD